MKYIFSPQKTFTSKSIVSKLPIGAIIFFLILSASEMIRSAQAPPLIQSMHIAKRTITVSANKEIKTRYLQDNFFATYDQDIDLTELPPTIALIPFLSAIAPIVWASGEDYYLDAMDADFATSLENIRNIYRRFYPSLSWSGNIIVHNLVDNKKSLTNSTNNTNNIGLLFGGGLDAVTSSIRNHQQPQLLITVIGAGIPLRNTRMWHEIRGQCQEFAAGYDHTHTFVKSNFITFARRKILSSLAPEIPNWWAYTTQSLGLCGVTAPILASKGISKLLIASSHTKQYPYAHGSHPFIDNAIAFANITVQHDSYDLNRQEKIAYLIDHVKKSDGTKPFLRVCFSSGTGGKNCSRCEKCLRTINGLLIEGEDPIDYGFPISTHEAINRTKKAFRGKQSTFRLHYDTVFHWEKMQERIRNILHQKQRPNYVTDTLKDYFSWLLTIDTNRCNVYKNRPFQKVQ